MEHRDWGRIQQIYHSALQLTPAERTAFVSNECGDDAALAKEVNELLSADEPSSGLLESPAFEMGLKLISRSTEANNIVGTTIAERYVVEKELGKGGMGTVFLARDLQLSGRLVVIKILIDAWFKDPDALTRFEREVHALTLIDQHPNVVSVYDAGELNDGKPYVVMQYIDGATLRTEIPSKGMDLNRAASILKQIGAALGHIHDKGILHRDLKPENIMVQTLSDGTELVKILDFGIAKIKDSVIASMDTNVPIGTEAYMSPEQRDGKNLTPASDVYAMAVIAYELVTGGRPQNSTGAPRRRGLSHKAEEIILRGLSLKPADRYRSAKQFGEDLHNALLEESAVGMNWLKAAAAVLIVALLSFGAYKYLSNRPAALPPRQGFDYWLMVQPTRDEKPYRDPIKSSGKDETFANGDKFQLNVLSRQSGYLYVFHERPPATDNAGFTMIYPQKRTNDASASIGANQTFQSDWLTFTGPPGTENFWIVASVSRVDELEAVKNQALTDPQAGLTDQNVTAVKEFFRTSQASVDVSVRRFEARQEATVLANSNLVLTLAQFKHR